MYTPWEKYYELLKLNILGKKRTRNLYNINFLMEITVVTHKYCRQDYEQVFSHPIECN